MFLFRSQSLSNGNYHGDCIFVKAFLFLDEFLITDFHTQVLNMLCCWAEDPNSEAFKLHLPRIYDYLWLAEDGMKMQVIMIASSPEILPY